MNASPLENALLDVLRRETGVPSLEYLGAPTRLTGGFWAELVGFQLAGAPAGWDGRLVARVMPDAAIAAKETAFQIETAAQGYETPRVLAAGDPADGLGRAFLVMDHVDGRPLLADLAGGAGVFVKLPSLARRLPVTLGRVLADLHRLDAGPVRRRLDHEGAAAGVDEALESLTAGAAALGRDDLADAGRWLATHAPSPAPVVVCHGDMHPFNVLVDDSGAVTVLDWSAGLMAPAAYDLAFTSLVLSVPPLQVPAMLQPAVGAAGRWLARRFLQAYRRAGGVAVTEESLRWHQGLVCLRALVEVAGWVSAGTMEGRDGHPWVISGDALAARLAGLTGAPVIAR